jgi:hypothetical protein
VRHGGLRGKWKSTDGVVLPAIVALSYQFKQEGKLQNGYQVGPTHQAYPNSEFTSSRWLEAKNP